MRRRTVRAELEEGLPRLGPQLGIELEHIVARRREARGDAHRAREDEGEPEDTAPQGGVEEEEQCLRGGYCR